MAVFSVDIRRPTVEGTFYGESYITTDQNQTLRSPFKFIVSKGSVSSETLFFDKAFPVSTQNYLHLYTTLNPLINSFCDDFLGEGFIREILRDFNL